MLKKIGLVLVILLGSMYLYRSWRSKNVSKETLTRDVETARLFDTRCGICHNNANTEAPGMEALKILPQDQIMASLSTGIMKNQAYMLSDKQHRALAEYISDVNVASGSQGVMKGRCAEGMSPSDLSAPEQINDWGMGYASTRYHDSEDFAINLDNIDQLKLKWAFAFPHASRARVQPTIIGNTLLTASQQGTIYALDRHTGCIRWTYQAEAEVRSALVVGRDSMGRANRLYFGDFNAMVYAVDLDNQSLLWKVKVDDHPVATITGTLSHYDGRLFIPVSSTEILSAANENYACCTFRGSMVALDTENGSMLWKTYTIDETPQEVKKNSKGVTNYGPSGAPIWTAVTIDTARNCLYIGSGENYTRPTTTTSDAIIAFDLDSGEMLWHRQTMAEDAWNGACVTLTSRANCPENTGPDADYGAPPILVNNNGRDLVLAGQKSGWVFALDPDDGGNIVWATQVGRGGFMGGIHWGMATDGTTLFVPINDRGLYFIHKDFPKKPGLHGVNVADGEILWSTIEKNRCGLHFRGCGPGLSAPITLTRDIVFTGTLDGIAKAYAADDGRELWAFDTKRDYETVNGEKGFGGAIDSDGPVVIENQMFVNSGYAKFNEKEGNVLLCFEIDEKG